MADRKPSHTGLVAVQHRAIEHLLRRGIDGAGPFKGARDCAEDALAGDRTREQAIKSLIRSHVTLAGAQGFVTNVGGLAALPITMPANVVAAYLLQIRLVAAIAHVQGHDLD